MCCWILNLNYARAFLSLCGLITFPISTLKIHDLPLTFFLFVFGGTIILFKQKLLNELETF